MYSVSRTQAVLFGHKFFGGAKSPFDVQDREEKKKHRTRLVISLMYWNTFHALIGTFLIHNLRFFFHSFHSVCVYTSWWTFHRNISIELFSIQLFFLKIDYVIILVALKLVEWVLLPATITPAPRMINDSPYIHSVLCERLKSSQHKKCALYICMTKRISVSIVISVQLNFKCIFGRKKWQIFREKVSVSHFQRIQFKTNYSTTEWSFFMRLLQHATVKCLLSKQYTQIRSVFQPYKTRNIFRIKWSNRIVICSIWTIYYTFVSRLNFIAGLKADLPIWPLFFSSGK